LSTLARSASKRPLPREMPGDSRGDAENQFPATPPHLRVMHSLFLGALGASFRQGWPGAVQWFTAETPRTPRKTELLNPFAAVDSILLSASRRLDFLRICSDGNPAARLRTPLSPPGVQPRESSARRQSSVGISPHSRPLCPQLVQDSMFVCRPPTAFSWQVYELPVADDFAAGPRRLGSDGKLSSDSRGGNSGDSSGTSTYMCRSAARVDRLVCPVVSSQESTTTVRNDQASVHINCQVDLIVTEKLEFVWQWTTVKDGRYLR
jgi:hypothetical protein